MATYAYDPYGEVTISNLTGNVATNLNPYRFAGGLHDRTTGYLKYGQRFYDPATGRFTQQDSLEVLADPSRGNRYEYAGSNPVNYVDPTGRDYEACVAVAAYAGFVYIVAQSPFVWTLGVFWPEYATVAAVLGLACATQALFGYFLE